MVGVHIPLSTLASGFSLQDEVLCLREWLGLQMGLFGSVGEFTSQEQTLINEGWELVDKYFSFSPSVGKL